MKLKVTVSDFLQDYPPGEIEVVANNEVMIEEAARERALEIIRNAYKNSTPGVVLAWFSVSIPEGTDIEELAEFLGRTPLNDFLGSLPSDSDCSFDILNPEPECPECPEGGHEWSSGLHSPCDTGYGRIVTMSRCVRCGMQRYHVTLCPQGKSLRKAGIPDESIEYGDPDPEWVRKYINPYYQPTY